MIKQFKLLMLMAVFTAPAAEPIRLLPFQGRLTDAAGTAVSDGAKLIQFQIYGEPTGGAALWAGEVHRTTVNGGLVNVMLGSRNPLPVNRSDDPNRSLFDSTLHLQITVDSNNDGKIDQADPPLLPRQAILPVLFAEESARSRNSDRLAGHDWGVLLVGGTNDPLSGKIRGDKIEMSGIQASQIANGAVTTSHLAPGSVTATIIADGSIASLDIADGAIRERHIEDQAIIKSKIASGAVTPEKLSIRPVGLIAPVGGVAISQTCGSVIIRSTTASDVANLSVKITTRGNPVRVFLISDGSSSDSDVGTIQFSNTNRRSSLGDVLFARENQIISQQRAGFDEATETNPAIYIPCGSYQFLDVVGAGTYTYKVQIRSVKGESPIYVNKIKLVAHEL